MFSGGKRCDSLDGKNEKLSVEGTYGTKHGFSETEF